MKRYRILLGRQRNLRMKRRKRGRNGCGRRIRTVSACHE
jgi:hypothetical protein